MSQLAKQYYKETGEKAMYKIGACDYQTIRYINWLENKVEKFTSNSQSISSVKCEVCKKQDAVISVCNDCYMAT